MKSYLTKDIRNVGIVGHGGTGKTQLVSSLLYTAGMTPRWGKVAEGSTTTDWDEEEVARKISIQTGLSYAEVGQSLGMTEAAVKKAAQRLRGRYREILRERIAGTIVDPRQVDDEIRALFAVLSS